MLPVKKKTIEVSYIETRPIIIPSFIIPVHYLKIGGILILSLLLFLTLTSVKEPATVQKHVSQETKSIVEICGLEPKKEYFKVPSEKVIQITDIIPLTESNRKVLDFICTNEVLSRAFKVQTETGLKIATIIGQKGVESAWNNSSLCKRTKNYGNIKCFKKHNHSKMGCIRAYDKIEGSNDWYVKVNTNWEGWNVYKELIDRRFTKAALQDNVYDQIVWLKKKRYATDCEYVSKVWKVVKNYNLLKLQEYVDAGYTITSSSGKFILLKQ